MASIKKMKSENIEKAIAEFESQVDFELVPVITQSSSYREHIVWILSLILVLLFLATIDFVFWDSWASRTYYYLAMPVVALVAGRFLSQFHAIGCLFISKKEQKRQVFEKCQRIFFLKQLDELKNNNSIILFVSIFEKQILILPDPKLKIQNLISIENHMLKLLQDDFKKGQFESGYLKAIQYLQQELIGHFPKNKQNNENLVANKLIWWNE